MFNFPGQYDQTVSEYDQKLPQSHNTEQSQILIVLPSMIETFKLNSISG